MKRHTYKNKNILGILLILTMVLAGVGLGMHNTDATEKTSDVTLNFTFQDSLSVEFPTGSGWSGNNHTTDLGSVNPGESKQGDVTGPIKVGSNAGSGFYLSATVGTKGGDGNLNLTSGTDPSNKVTLLTGPVSATELARQSGSVWGFRYATSDAGNIDTALGSASYDTLPLDASDNGASGKKLIESGNQGEKSLKYQVGIKTDPTLKAGTYQNVIHFYAVSK